MRIKKENRVLFLEHLEAVVIKVEGEGCGAKVDNLFP
jgi:hypothetical protein